MNILKELRNGKDLTLGFGICSRKSELRRLKTLVSELLSRCYEPEGANRLILAFDEILTNAYEHGSLELTKDDKTSLSFSQKLEEELIIREALYGGRKILVEIALKRDQCIVTVEDEGAGFEWQHELQSYNLLSLLDTTLEGATDLRSSMILRISSVTANNKNVGLGYSGRGLLLAHKLVNELTFTHNPTRCSMLKYLRLL